MKRIATFALVSLLLFTSARSDSLDEDEINKVVGSPQVDLTQRELLNDFA